MNCPRCDFAILPEIPIEPLYTLPDVAMVIPTRLSTLKRALTRHKAQLGPPWYSGSWGRRHRLLSASDVRFLRSVLVSHLLRKLK